MRALALALAMLTLTVSASAETWLTVPTVSRHFTPRENYNEVNLGLGLEIGSASARFSFGSYRNTYRQQTVFAGVLWQPIRLGNKCIAGGIAALASGYEQISKYPIFGALSIECSWNEKYGAQLLSVPQKDGMIALQFKIRM